MRFALLGDHPDGIALASALVTTGRHELIAYSGAAPGLTSLRTSGLNPTPVGDLEAVLADPRVEAVIVASPRAVRGAHLKRALQSERHVLCVHPPEARPDIGYEAALIRNDTGRVLMPILPNAFHPLVRRLRSLVNGPDVGLEKLVFVEVAGLSGEAFLDAEHPDSDRVNLAIWPMLLAVGGEIAEVAGLAAGEVAVPGETLLLTGRYQSGAFFQVRYLPSSANSAAGLSLVAIGGKVEVDLDSQQTGVVKLRRHRPGEVPVEETLATAIDWAAAVEAFERKLGAGGKDAIAPGEWGWQDAIRCLELDDAVRRGVERRRVVALEYPEASEEVGFKGTMTLLGCGLLLFVLVVVLIVGFFDWARGLWLVGPLLFGFLALQLLRWLVPSAAAEKPEKPSFRKDNF